MMFYDENADYSESIVDALVLDHFGRKPDLMTPEFYGQVIWCMVGDCPERREADRRIWLMEVGR
jgi:hypothetical protein